MIFIFIIKRGKSWDFRPPTKRVRLVKWNALKSFRKHDQLLISVMSSLQTTFEPEGLIIGLTLTGLKSEFQIMGELRLLLGAYHKTFFKIIYFNETNICKHFQQYYYTIANIFSFPCDTITIHPCIVPLSNVRGKPFIHEHPYIKSLVFFVPLYMTIMRIPVVY